MHLLSLDCWEEFIIYMTNNYTYLMKNPKLHKSTNKGNLNRKLY